MGMIDMVSRPPATMTSAPPLLIRSAAIAIDCKPEEQKRLIVIALVSTGSPARIAAARATFIPCSASGIAQPMITSSISPVLRPVTRRTASLITTAPISSGRVFLNVPFGALPTAVLTADTITASLIFLIPQWLPSLQHMRDALLSLAFAYQRQERFALEIQKVLFGDSRRVIQIASSKNSRKLFTNLRVMIRDVSGPLHLVNAELQSSQRRQA